MAKATQTTRKTTKSKKTTATWSLSKAISSLTGNTNKKSSSGKSTGKKRCPTCGKYMGNGGSK